MKLEKIARTVHGDGSSEIRYRYGSHEIESRKKAIPHANGNSGVWFHTTFFLIRPDGTEKEYWSLADAKKSAEASQ